MRKHPDYQDMTREDRIMTLNNTSDRVMENYSFSRPLTEKEIATKNSDLNQALQNIRNLEDKRKEINDLMKIEKEIVQESNKQILNGFVECNERIWEVVDTVNGTLDRINADGLIIDTIRLKNAQEVSIFNKSNKNEKNGTE